MEDLETEKRGKFNITMRTVDAICLPGLRQPQQQRSDLATVFGSSARRQACSGIKAVGARGSIDPRTEHVNADVQSGGGSCRQQLGG